MPQVLLSIRLSFTIVNMKICLTRTFGSAMKYHIYNLEVRSTYRSHWQGMIHKLWSPSWSSFFLTFFLFGSGWLDHILFVCTHMRNQKDWLIHNIHTMLYRICNYVLLIYISLSHLHFFGIQLFIKTILNTKNSKPTVLLYFSYSCIILKKNIFISSILVLWWINQYVLTFLAHNLGHSLMQTLIQI